MDAYTEGYEAFHRGVMRRCNPWADGTRGFYQWFKGWDAAARAATV